MHSSQITVSARDFEWWQALNRYICDCKQFALWSEWTFSSTNELTAKNQTENLFGRAYASAHYTIIISSSAAVNFIWMFHNWQITWNIHCELPIWLCDHGNVDRLQWEPHHCIHHSDTGLQYVQINNLCVLFRLWEHSDQGDDDCSLQRSNYSCWIPLINSAKDKSKKETNIK